MSDKQLEKQVACEAMRNAYGSLPTPDLEGQIRIAQKNMAQNEKVKCEWCDGWGCVDDGGHSKRECWECEGEGEIKREKLDDFRR
tara:strand:- start:536 stop:790 length:255 start_codon:yes stop_codon:yes gene_type:complete